VVAASDDDDDGAYDGLGSLPPLPTSAHPRCHAFLRQPSLPTSILPLLTHRLLSDDSGSLPYLTDDDEIGSPPVRIRIASETTTLSPAPRSP
jgi:hypothetical protein